MGRLPALAVCLGLLTGCSGPGVSPEPVDGSPPSATRSVTPAPAPAPATASGEAGLQGGTVLVSRTSSGSVGNAGSGHGAVSADASVVVFTSAATDLVDGDVAGDGLFLFDRTTGHLELLSAGVAEDPRFFVNHVLDVSSDGRFVAFSAIEALVSQDQNDTMDVYLLDRDNGSFVQVSTTGEPTSNNRAALFPSVSDDGTVVTFVSPSTDFVPDDRKDVNDMFAVDLATGAIRLVSKAERWAHGTRSGEVSGDGTAVAFESDFGYLRNLATDQITWFERCGEPSVSADGRYVACNTGIPAIVPGLPEDSAAVVVVDTTTGQTELVSVGADGAPVAGWSALPSISADGRKVAFVSNSPDLVPGDTNGVPDVFVTDLDAGTTVRVSVSAAGEQGNGESRNPRLSPDGSWVLYASDATNLVPGDTNQAPDLFLSPTS